MPKSYVSGFELETLRMKNTRLDQTCANGNFDVMCDRQLNYDVTMCNVRRTTKLWRHVQNLAFLYCVSCFATKTIVLWSRETCRVSSENRCVAKIYSTTCVEEAGRCLAKRRRRSRWICEIFWCSLCESYFTRKTKRHKKVETTQRTRNKRNKVASIYF